MKIPEYDDGYISRDAFEQAFADQPEDVEPDPTVDCESSVGDVFGWLDDDQLATEIGQELAQALNIRACAGVSYYTTHGQKTAAGLARLVWALIHDALPNR